MRRLNRRARSALHLLRHNPYYLVAMANAQVRPLISSSSVPTGWKIGKISFESGFPDDPFVRAMYWQQFEISTICAMRRFLRPGATFIDVGANIGYFSAVAANLVGPSGQVHAFEPVPRYYERLRLLADRNSTYHIVPNQIALGEVPGLSRISLPGVRNIGGNTMVDGLIPVADVEARVDVPVARLDAYIQDNRLEDIALIKIDCEGFEFPVLRGLSGFLDQTRHRPPIVCEVVPSAYPHLGSSLVELAEYLGRYGYRSVNIFDLATNVDIVDLTDISTLLIAPR